jgi:hypothetical protein
MTLSAGVVYYITTDDYPSYITGIAGGLVGKYVILVNTTANVVDILANDGGSSTTNQFRMNANVSLATDHTASFIYGPSSVGNRWLKLTNT